MIVGVQQFESKQKALQMEIVEEPFLENEQEMEEPDSEDEQAPFNPETETYVMTENPMLRHRHTEQTQSSSIEQVD